MSIFNYIDRKCVRRDQGQSLQEQYSPTRVEDIYGRAEEVQTLKVWLQAFKAKNKGQRRFAMISGPSGVGKSMLVTATVRACGMHIMDMNQNSPKTRREITDALSTCNHTYVALFDEFDFMEGFTIVDLKVLMDSFPTVPFIFIVNKYTHGKTFDLSKDALHICMDPLPADQMMPWILLIMEKEGIYASHGQQGQHSIAETLTGMCNGDMRFALNWLGLHHKQARGQSPRLPSNSNNWTTAAFRCHFKDEDINCIKATKMLLYEDGHLDVHSAINLVHYDMNLITSMVSENYLSVVDDRDPACMEKLSRCADVISFADVVETNIYSNQVWGMWDLFVFAGAVYPSLTVRRKIDDSPSFTKMWSVVSNMYYRIYRIEEVRLCLLRRKMSIDRDALMGMGSIIYNHIASGNIQGCMAEMVSLGLTSDNINMLVKCGAMLSYKNTLQKKIKKEYDRIVGRPATSSHTIDNSRTKTGPSLSSSTPSSSRQKKPRQGPQEMTKWTPTTTTITTSDASGTDGNNTPQLEEACKPAAAESIVKAPLKERKATKPKARSRKPEATEAGDAHAAAPTRQARERCARYGADTGHVPDLKQQGKGAGASFFSST